MAMSFVVSAYRGILRREPDPVAIHSYVPALGAKRLSRADLLQELVSLAEFRSRLADKSSAPIIGEIMQELETVLNDQFGFRDREGCPMKSLGYEIVAGDGELAAITAIRDLVLVLKDRASLGAATVN